MNNFYSFQWAQKKGEIRVESLNPYNDQEIKLGNYLVHEPFVVKISEGKNLYDIVHFQDPFNFAISERVYRLLTEAGLTGWSSYEIAIEERDEKYYGFQVTSRCGELRRPREAGFVEGYEFEIESWDGSDFFCPQGTLLVFCTERANRLLTTSQITNLRLAEIGSIQWYNAGSA